MDKDIVGKNSFTEFKKQIKKIYSPDTYQEENDVDEYVSGYLDIFGVLEEDKKFIVRKRDYEFLSMIPVEFEETDQSSQDLPSINSTGYFISSFMDKETEDLRSISRISYWVDSLSKEQRKIVNELHDDMIKYHCSKVLDDVIIKDLAFELTGMVFERLSQLRSVYVGSEFDFAKLEDLPKGFQETILYYLKYTDQDISLLNIVCILINPSKFDTIKSFVKSIRETEKQYPIYYHETKKNKDVKDEKILEEWEDILKNYKKNKKLERFVERIWKSLFFGTGSDKRDFSALLQHNLGDISQNTQDLSVIGYLDNIIEKGKNMKDEDDKHLNMVIPSLMALITPSNFRKSRVRCVSSHSETKISDFLTNTGPYKKYSENFNNMVKEEHIEKYHITTGEICPTCKGRNVIIILIQTRSNDESATQIKFCQDCNKSV